MPFYFVLCFSFKINRQVIYIGIRKYAFKEYKSILLVQFKDIKLTINLLRKSNKLAYFLYN